MKRFSKWLICFSLMITSIMIPTIAKAEELTTLLGARTLSYTTGTLTYANIATTPILSEYNKGQDIMTADVNNTSTTTQYITYTYTPSWGSATTTTYSFNPSITKQIKISQMNCSDGKNYIYIWQIKTDGTLGTHTQISNIYDTRTITFASVTVPTSAMVTLHIDAPIPTSQEDMLNYNWEGNGIKIYNLEQGMNVSGYIQDTLKYFDIETYGKFVYNGSNTFFTSMAYKKMQTSIQLASSVNYGDLSRRTGEGLGIKSFQWVSNTSQLNTGDIIKFRIVYQVPMLEKGGYDIKIGTTVNDGVADIWVEDKVSGVNFLNSNWTYGEQLDTTGETGNVGTEPGNQPIDETVEPTGSLSSMLTIFSSFSGFIGSLFGFLPTEVKVLFVGACTIITGLMIKRAVL